MTFEELVRKSIDLIRTIDINKANLNEMMKSKELLDKDISSITIEIDESIIELNKLKNLFKNIE